MNKKMFLFVLIFSVINFHFLMGAEGKIHLIASPGTLSMKDFMQQTYDKSLSNMAKVDRLRAAAGLWMTDGYAPAIAEYKAIIRENPVTPDHYANSLGLAATAGLLNVYMDYNNWGKDGFSDTTAAKAICLSLLGTNDKEFYFFGKSMNWYGHTWPEAYLRLASIDKENALDYYRILITNYGNVLSGEDASDACNSYSGYAINMLFGDVERNTAVARAAIDMLREAIKTVKSRELKSQIQYQIGNLYERCLKDYGKAIEEYGIGIKDYEMPFDDDSDRMNFTVESKNRIEWIRKTYGK